MDIFLKGGKTMAKGKVVDSRYLYQQLVVERIGIENMFRPLLFGQRIRKRFENGYELAEFVYNHHVSNKIAWFLGSPIDFLAEN